MAEIIFVLMLFVVINSAFKLSFWKWWQVGIFSLLAAIFTMAMCPLAILQSKTQLADYLQNISALQDMAILITLETLLCLGFCMTRLDGMFEEEGSKRKWWTRLLWWYPGLLIFPVLFYCLTELIFTFAGVPFMVTAGLLATAVFVLLPFLALLMKHLVPEPELRLEIHFLVSLLICVLGLLSTVNGRTVYAAVSNPISLGTLAIALGFFVILFMVGYIWNSLKFPFLQKRRKKGGKI